MVKLPRIEKNKNGQKKNPKLEEFTLSMLMTKYSEIIKNARMELERPVAPAMPCKRDKQLSSSRKVVQRNGNELKTLHGCVVEAHESTRQRAESLLSKTRRSHCWERIYFYDTL